MFNPSHFLSTPQSLSLSLLLIFQGLEGPRLGVGIVKGNGGCDAVRQPMSKRDCVILSIEKKSGDFLYAVPIGFHLQFHFFFFTCRKNIPEVHQLP